MSRPSKRIAIERLERVQEEINNLEQLSHRSPEFDKWNRNSRIVIANTFGEDSGHVTEFSNISFSPFMFAAGGSDSQFQQPYLRGLATARAILESMVDEVREYWKDYADSASSDVLQEQVDASLDSGRVFVVHGRDEGAKSTLARFLEGLDLVPVVLAELPAEGQTIIEKFESQSDVGYAVALFTPDDVGALNSESELSPRARQNVIFELGFFIGKLGRDRVCALTKGPVEIPSDYAGVEYISLDEAGAWKMTLFRELRTAGFNIDANRLVGG